MFSLFSNMLFANGKDNSIVDLMPNVWKFEAVARGKSIKKQVELFKKIVITPNRELYNHELFSPDDESLEIYLKDIWEIMP